MPTQGRPSDVAAPPETQKQKKQNKETKTVRVVVRDNRHPHPTYKK